MERGEAIDGRLAGPLWKTRAGALAARAETLRGIFASLTKIAHRHVSALPLVCLCAGILLAGLAMADLAQDLRVRLAEGERVAQGLVSREAQRWNTRGLPLEQDLASFAATLPWRGATLTLIDNTEISAAGRISYPRDVAGRALLAARAPLQDGAFALALTLPLETLLAPWYARMPRMVLLAFLALATGAGLAFVARRAHKRALAAEALHAASESRLTFAVSHAGFGEWRWAIDGRGFTISASFAVLLGLDRPWPDLDDAELAERVHSADRAALSALATNARLGRPEIATTLRFLHAEGQFVWLRLVGRRDTDAQGRLILSGIAIDVSAQSRQAEALAESETLLKDSIGALEGSRAKLREQTQYLILLAERYATEKKRAEAASAAKSEFLANMSHELLTPLNAILGFSEIVKSEMFGPVGDKRYRGYAEDIHQAGQELVALINDILDMSRIDSGDRALKREPLNPALPLRDALAVTASQASDAHIRIDDDVALLPALSADRRALAQVFTNLLSNAIKFTPQGGRISLTSAVDARSVTIAVTDTGIGIAPEDIERLGHPFVQLEPQTIKRYKGSGLGLALAKSLVELHGGQIVFESALGAGTTVRVVLPRMNEELKTLPERPSTMARAGGSRAGIVERASRG